MWHVRKKFGLEERSPPEKYRAHFDPQTPQILNLSHSYMWGVRKKFGAVSEKVGNCALEAPKSSVHPIEIGFAETSCN